MEKRLADNPEVKYAVEMMQMYKAGFLDGCKYISKDEKLKFKGKLSKAAFFRFNKMFSKSKLNGGKK